MMTPIHIGWPEGIYLTIMFLGICIHLSKNGKPIEHTYDAGSRLLGSALILSLLYWGGFFS